MNAIAKSPMPKRLLPFIPTSLRVIAVASEPERVTVMAVPRSAAAYCPVCRRHSDRTHGSYERRLADLPWQGRSVSLCVRLRRLCCRNPACSRRTFSQRLPDVAVPRARRSRRLQDVQRHLGLALGGAPAARLAHRLALPASPSTFLRMVRAGPAPVPWLPRVIAIDEWAWRRGRRYGKIIVDLERNTIAELLSDRDAATVADWLRRHPSVEIVARDRAEVYGECVRQGAPGVVHVLDRWHVLRNLSEALQEAVTAQHSVIRLVARTLGDERAAAHRAERNRFRPLTSADRRKQEKHAPVRRATPNSGAFVRPVRPSPALPAISISIARPYGDGCGGTSHRPGKSRRARASSIPTAPISIGAGPRAAATGPSWPANSTGSAPDQAARRPGVGDGAASGRSGQPRS